MYFFISSMYVIFLLSSCIPPHDKVVSRGCVGVSFCRLFDFFFAFGMRAGEHMFSHIHELMYVSMHTYTYLYP